MFGPIIVEVLELFRCVLGGFMGRWSISWEAYGPQKNIEQLCFFSFLQLQDFGFLKLLVVLLGPSWPLIGQICSQNASVAPQSSKNCPKTSPKNNSNNNRKMQVLGPEMGP